MLHWNFRLSAFGFFDLDMPLFYSVKQATFNRFATLLNAIHFQTLCSAATYLMILLQLDMANKQIEESLKVSSALSIWTEKQKNNNKTIYNTIITQYTSVWQARIKVRLGFLVRFHYFPIFRVHVDLILDEEDEIRGYIVVYLKQK